MYKKDNLGINNLLYSECEIVILRLTIQFSRFDPLAEYPCPSGVSVAYTVNQSQSQFRIHESDINVTITKKNLVDDDAAVDHLLVYLFSVVVIVVFLASAPSTPVSIVVHPNPSA